MMRVKQCLACRFCRLHSVLRAVLVIFAFGFSAVALGFVRLPM